MDAAREIGGAVQEKFGWKVKMKGFDIEVVANVDSEQVYFCLTLTRESLFKRNISHFGPTTLRATICSALLSMADVKPGDVVVDPMCGGGSIPIEGAMAYKSGFYLAGDIHDKAYTRARQNATALEEETLKSRQLDVVQWDVMKIPLRMASVDVFVTDLPFGKRSGSKADNRVLYPNTMLAMARVVKPVTGKAVILTYDKTSMFKSIGKFNEFWKLGRQSYANIGGLAALVFVFSRTEKVPDTSNSSRSCEQL